MKKTIFIAILTLLCSTLTQAQKDPIRDFYRHYNTSPNATGVRIQGLFIRLASKVTDAEDASKLLRKISRLELLQLENGEQPLQEDFDRLIKGVKAESYEDLIMMRGNNEHVNLLIREKDGIINNILILVRETDEFLMLHLECKLRFSDLNDLDIDVDGAEHLKSLPENRFRA